MINQLVERLIMKSSDAGVILQSNPEKEHSIIYKIQKKGETNPAQALGSGQNPSRLSPKCKEK